MANRSFWISLAASALSFVAGFLLANALNRRELDARPPASAELTPAQNSDKDNGGLSLSKDEIKQKVAAANANPGDFTVSKKSRGFALPLFGVKTGRFDLAGRDCE